MLLEFGVRFIKVFYIDLRQILCSNHHCMFNMYVLRPIFFTVSGFVVGQIRISDIIQNHFTKKMGRQLYPVNMQKYIESVTYQCTL